MKRRIEKCSRVFFFLFESFSSSAQWQQSEFSDPPTARFSTKIKKKVKKYLKMVAVNLGAV
jgi:hypothetical protein